MFLALVFFPVPGFYPQQAHYYSGSRQGFNDFAETSRKILTTEVLMSQAFFIFFNFLDRSNFLEIFCEQ